MVAEQSTTELRIEKPIENIDKRTIFAAVRNNFLRYHLDKRSPKLCDATTTCGQDGQDEKPSSLAPSIITRTGVLETFTGMPLEVNWGITKMCNYKCSYCFGQDALDNSRFTSLAYLKKAVDHIAELNRDTVRFTFGGGEPTTHPGLGELIEHIHHSFANRLQSVLVISNGSRNPKLYDRLVENEEIDRLRFNISLHTEFMELDHITSLIECLSHKALLSLNLMFHPLKRDFVRAVHQKLCELRLAYPFTLHVIFLLRKPRFDTMDERYLLQDFEWQKQATEEFGRAAQNGPDMTFLTQRGYSGDLFWNYADPARPYQKMAGKDRDTLLAEGNFNFKGMHCIHGSSLLCIGPDGTASGARCPEARKTYNIFQENPFTHRDFIRPVRCSSANCGCATNDQLPKFASEEEAHDFAEMYRFRQAERMTR
ncbi:MAG: radical SAM protein [Desulfovibrio sp.]|nr:radical SAM protein [Desulfovibrio sp.]